jgi:putative Holliday junction resolvase
MSSTEEKRILAIDYGLRRVGLAITDPLKFFAYPLTTLQNDKNFWNELQKIFSEYSIAEIVLGYPLKENGEKTDVTDDIITFKKELEDKFRLPVKLVDERYSSEIAKQRVLESVPSKKKRRNKELVDKNAAAVLLEDYLSEHSG